MLKNKKAVDLISSVVIFVILNVLFFSMMFLYLGNVSSGASFTENVYSKKIALAIDDLRPGTELTIYAPELFNVAEKNGLAPDKILDIDYGHRTVTIRVANENGKTYGYFSDLKQGSISLDSNTKSITILS